MNVVLQSCNLRKETWVLSLRVIAGKYKGRKLIRPTIDEVRPTKDVVKGAIFNALGSSIINSNVLDLFAGSGALGIEALSRRAKYAIFVDSNKDAINCIKTNLAFVEEKYYIFKADYAKVLQNYTINSKIDIVFIDPPYDGDILKIVDEVKKSGVLKKNGIIVIETDEKLSIGEDVNEKIRHYHFGLSNLYIIWRFN
ncbi:MAG TPA: 16S rRNA (guanine(966)-N(2))-methyltransferase RsmD [Bacilli bacterium]|nr:16S rRNA (guanine(966)-N(2))-methyltransferase RsmD [Bacilli bacterium]